MKLNALIVAPVRKDEQMNSPFKEKVVFKKVALPDGRVVTEKKTYYGPSELQTTYNYFDDTGKFLAPHFPRDYWGRILDLKEVK